MRFNTFNPYDLESSQESSELEITIEIEFAEPELDIITEKDELPDYLKVDEYQIEEKPEFTQEDLSKILHPRIP